MNVFIQFAIHAILSALQTAVKNPQHKKELRNAMLELSQEINIVYADDSAFKK